MVKRKPGDGIKGSHVDQVIDVELVGVDRVASTTRWDPEVFDALTSASALTGNSFNSLVNKAAATYLTTPEFNAELDDAQRRAREAIDKLAGGL